MADIPGRLQIGTSLEDAFNQINEAFQAIDSENRTKIIKNGLIPKLLFGYQKGGFGTQNYGLKIAKEGFDVTTATDDQLAFSSAFDTLKIIASDTLTTSACPPLSSVSDQVNLGPITGHPPAYLAYFDNGFSRTQLPVVSVANTAPYVLSAYSAVVELSGSDVLFIVTSINNDAILTTAGGDVRYYIFEETA